MKHDDYIRALRIAVYRWALEYLEYLPRGAFAALVQAMRIRQ